MIKYLHNRKGFTLIEILVVVAIVAIVSGIGASTYFRLKPTIRVNGAARQIVGDMMWAKMRAVSENNNYVITFGINEGDFSNNTYNIYDVNNNNFNSESPDQSELVKTVVISDRYGEVRYGGTTEINGDPIDDKYVRFGNTGNNTTKPVYVRFKSTGRPSTSGTVYIMYNDDLINYGAGTMRAITVSPAGRIRIQKYTGSGWQ
ncbi:MAG: GspH/FimT family pseudopilin [Candidatus Anammoxibacter sp.]